MLRARRYLGFGLLVGSFLQACQSEPDPALMKRGDITAVKRDEFFKDKANTETVSAEQIAKDQKVKDLSQQVKQDPFQGCGYSSIAASDAVTLEPISLKNAGSKIVSGRVTIVVNGGINLGGSLSSLNFSNNFSVVSATPNNATNAANREALKSSFKTDFQAISQLEAQAALAATAEKPVCGVVMVRGQKSLALDNMTFINASYDKPVVQMISPKMTVERIKLQLQAPIKITGITATLETNDQAIIDSGLIKKGEVEVALIPAERSLTDSLGNPVNIKAEVAYRVTNKFMDASAGNAGQASVLDQIAEFYISGQKVTHLIVKTPRPEMPLIIYAQP